MATYQGIRLYVMKKYGFVPTPCWIAHAKELCGIPVRKASNRIDPNKRIDPCPEDKLPAIRNAFKYFGMI
ncbi:MAG TPA: hypothetical protein VMX17_17275 [Candidatus Glassbacteria bacterium]|nr:hypothetical protein [Candidatus Glassbacteria bacterium]